MIKIKKKILIRIIKVVLVLIVFLIIALTNGTNRNITKAENLLLYIISIPQKIVYSIGNIINDSEFLNTIEEVKEENKKLNKENKELLEKLSDYYLISEENKLLKSQSTIRSSYSDYNVVIANVVAGSPNNFDEIFVIDKGEKDGIKPNMPVITKDGLVGMITDVSRSSSKLITILDASMSLSGRATKTREEVIVRGNNLIKAENKLKITDIPYGVIFESGDSIETSGIGTIYPKGIKIGEITKFIKKDNPLENEAEVKASVNFSKLETVAIIIATYEE